MDSLLDIAGMIAVQIAGIILSPSRSPCCVAAGLLRTTHETRGSKESGLRRGRLGWSVAATRSETKAEASFLVYDFGNGARNTALLVF